ncbi:hypothetical protein GGF41_006520 [Coemansia sp. RSA 2531]|nr:hypothetical protein GGF41_006520 [Coemansia sp. RSA 2531]
MTLSLAPYRSISCSLALLPTRSSMTTSTTASMIFSQRYPHHQPPQVQYQWCPFKILLRAVTRVVIPPYPSTARRLTTCWIGILTWTMRPSRRSKLT